jgi:hypothetical protein
MAASRLMTAGSMPSPEMLKNPRLRVQLTGMLVLHDEMVALYGDDGVFQQPFLLQESQERFDAKSADKM